jgi:hypothetical protein
MTTSYKYLMAFLLFLAGAGTQAQNSYLLNFEHKEARKAENIYFYMEALAPGAPRDRADVVSLENGLYQIHYLRLSEPSASSYMGCLRYASQVAGEQLSVRDLLSDSVLTSYGKKQEAIEAECMSLLENRGRQNSMLTIKLNDQDRVRMVPIDLSLCNCKVSGAPFSPVSDTLAMVRTIKNVAVFSESEKSYWKERIGFILDNQFVNSCLPQPERFAKVYQASLD